MKIPSALVGCQVARTAFDYQARISFTALDPDEGYRVDAELIIDTPFLLRDAAGEWFELDPGSGASLAPVLDLFTKTVKTVEIRDAGALYLTFDDHSELFIGPDREFQSWRISGTGIDNTVVGPGGHTEWERV